MADRFTFQVPEFNGFDDNDDSVESYFDVDHESQAAVQQKDEFYTPSVLPSGKSGKNLRRSISVGNLKLDDEVARNNACEEDLSDKLGNLKINNGIKKSGSRTTLYRSNSRDNFINKISAAKETKGKFVSMVELVRKYHTGTPDRYRSKPQPQQPQPVYHPMPRTIPLSPPLLTKTRNRPILVLSITEQEVKDFEEAKRFRIRSHPVNKKILKGPVKPNIPIAVKPSTIPQPFNITAAPKKTKVADSPKRDTKIHPKPVPKSVYQSPKMSVAAKKVTHPVTPSFMKNYVPKYVPPKLKNFKSDPDMNKQKLERTIVIPFSFERRDKFLMQKKEQFIEKFIQEEKKKREFHANPLPKLYQYTDSSTALSGKSSNHSGTQEPDCPSPFKARAPTVLYKEPFVPKKGDKPLTELLNFELNTEKRSREREEFEKKVKEREEQIAQQKEEQEQMRLVQEQAEVQQIRKMATHKAQPVRRYRPLVIEPSNKVTLPISPDFATDKIRNKENTKPAATT